MERKFRTKVLSFPEQLLILAAVLLSACASAPVVKSMTPSAGADRFISTGKTIKVAGVTGGEKTNPMGRSVIEKEGFQAALEEALRNSGIFGEVFMDREGDYTITADIISQEMMGGLTVSSVLYVEYRLDETASKKEIWKENILTQYDAQFKDAAYGVTRARLANEGAVRENLSQLLKKLYAILPKNNP